MPLPKSAAATVRARALGGFVVDQRAREAKPRARRAPAEARVAEEADVHRREVKALGVASAGGERIASAALRRRGRRLVVAGEGRKLDLPAAQAHGARADHHLAAGAELRLGDLEAASRLRRARRDGQRRHRHRPQEVEGQPGDEVALLLDRLGDQRARSPAVQLAGIPGPARVPGGDEGVALAAEDGLAQRSSLRTTSLSRTTSRRWPPPCCRPGPSAAAPRARRPRSCRSAPWRRAWASTPRPSRRAPPPRAASPRGARGRGAA